MGESFCTANRVNVIVCWKSCCFLKPYTCCTWGISFVQARCVFSSLFFSMSGEVKCTLFLVEVMQAKYYLDGQCKKQLSFVGIVIEFQNCISCASKRYLVTSHIACYFAIHLYLLYNIKSTQGRNDNGPILPHLLFSSSWQMMVGYKMQLWSNDAGFVLTKTNSHLNVCVRIVVFKVC